MTDNPTDIGKNKSTVSSMIDALRLEIRELQKFATVQEDLIVEGGNPRANIKVPKKLTAEQTIQFMKQFPNGFPLADENAFFGIARALSLESPELFDVDSFDAYEKKFGNMMEMQEKGASASKNIVAGKPLQAANEPTTEGKPVAEETVDYKAKIRNNTITVREAFEATLARNLTKSKIEDITGLLNNLEKEGVDLDAPYFEVYDTEDFARRLDYRYNKTGSHRFGAFGSFETELAALHRQSGRNDRYVRLSGSDGIATQDFRLIGVQLRGKDPMRGLVPSEALDRIYDEALSQSSYQTYTKAGKAKTVVIDPATRDYLLYEKYTGQRLDSNIGEDGIKVGDVSFYTDKNGNRVANIVEKVSVNKTRPATTYVGPFAEFIEDVVNRRMSTLPEGADITQADLFDTKQSKIEGVWNALIRPKLEKNFSRFLPEKKQGSHSVLRKILARQLVQELDYPRDAVKSWMGHAGAGVNDKGDILEASYTGAVPDRRIAGMTDTFVRNDAFNTGASNVNSLFVDRGVNHFAGITVKYSTPEAKIEYEEGANLAGPSQQTKLTDGELNELSAKAQTRALETEKANIQLETEVFEARSQAQVTRAQIKAENEKRRQKLGLTSSTSDTPPVEEQKFSGFDDKLKQKLKDKGINIPVGTGGIDFSKKSIPATIATGLAGAGALASKTTKAVATELVPGISIPLRREELIRKGDDPTMATVKAVGEELITPLGVSTAIVEEAGVPLAEEIQEQTPPEGMLQGLGRALTGQGMNIRFQSGGFVNRNGRK